MQTPTIHLPPHSEAPIGIVAAMPEELQGLLDRMVNDTPVRLAGRTFWRGQVQGCEVVAVLSGIGKVAAAITTTLLVQALGAREVWFTGVAGGLAPQVRVGDVVVANALLQHDLDVSPLFPRHEIPGLGLSQLCPPAALHRWITHTINHGLGWPVHEGLVISGDQFVASAEQVQTLLLDCPDALAVEMEGAVVAQVCHAFAVPYAVIRIISDRADDDAHIDFGRFVTEIASPRSLAMIDALLTARRQS